MNVADGVAVRISAMCLARNGRLVDRLLASDAVRGALLVDLALACRMTSAEDSIVVDGTPTAFAPADRLLAAMSAEAERPLDGWLDERRIGLRDVAEANVVTGRWERRPGLLGLRPRYTDRHIGQTERDLSRSASDWSTDASPEDACVTVIAATSGLLDRELGVGQLPSPAVLAATGDAEWLCPTVVEYLTRTAARYRHQAGALGIGSF